MKTITYKMFDGRIVELEVTDEFAQRYVEFERDEQRRIWREQKRVRKEVSFERLLELGKDFADPNSRDPLEILIEKEEQESALSLFSLVTDLTEYQRRVAIKLYVEYKNQTMIAKEEGVSKAAISRLVAKANNKILKALLG